MVTATRMTTEIPIWTTTTRFRIRNLFLPEAIAASIDLSPTTKSAFELCSAGARPKKSTLKSPAARLNRSTRWSDRMSIMKGRSEGILILLKRWAKAQPNHTPVRVPAMPNSRLSLSNCRTRRARLAPIASRTAISRIRARLNSRLATLKQSEEHTSELQSLAYLVCRLLLEKKKQRVQQQRSPTPQQTLKQTPQA